MHTDWLGLILLLAAGLAVFVFAVILYTFWLLTHPPRRTYSWAVSRGVPGDPAEVRTGATAPASTGFAFESWSFGPPPATPDQDLPVWDIRGANPAGPTVIVTHGWGDSRVTMLSRLPALASVASRVLMFDLPGHGEARGTCALGTREVELLVALIEHVSAPPQTTHATPSLTPAQIVLYGFSLGAGVSIAAAARSAPGSISGSGGGGAKIAGVIAEAPYRLPITPARNVLRMRALPYRWNLPIAIGLLGLRLGQGLSWFNAREPQNDEQPIAFDRAALARRLVCPLLVIHGERDEVCPPADGRSIAAAAPGAASSFVLIEGAGHLDLWTEPRSAQSAAEAIASFVTRLDL